MKYFFLAPLTWSAGSKSPVYQVGLFSFNINGCGSKSYPDQYTRISSFTDWFSDVGISRGRDCSGAMVPTYSNKCSAQVKTCNPSCGSNASCNKNLLTCECHDGFAGDPYLACGKITISHITTMQKLVFRAQNLQLLKLV